MTSKLAKILSSLTKASNEKLDEVIASLEQEEPSSKPGIYIYMYNYFTLMDINANYEHIVSYLNKINDDIGGVLL